MFLRNLTGSNAAHDTFRKVLGNVSGLVEHVELLRGVLSCPNGDRLLATWMLSKKLSEVENLRRKRSGGLAE